MVVTASYPAVAKQQHARTAIGGSPVTFATQIWNRSLDSSQGRKIIFCAQRRFVFDISIDIPRRASRRRFANHPRRASWPASAKCDERGWFEKQNVMRCRRSLPPQSMMRLHC